MAAAGVAEKGFRMKKILFTGNAKLIIDDLMAHMPEEYVKLKCPCDEVEFMEAIKSFSPDVIVAGLHKETKFSVYMYTLLKGTAKYDHLPIMVIGGEEDCDIFYKNVFQNNMQIFKRPLDMELFLKTLEDFIVLSQTYVKHTENEAAVSVTDQEQLADRALHTGIAGENTEVPGRTVSQEVKEQQEMRGNEQVRKNILVVDDDVRMLDLIKMYLQDLYSVTVVPSGKLALKYLYKKPADLVLLDYMMPGQDGPDVLREIRINSPCPDIPVVFLTGVADKEKVMKGLEMRPQGYILKPVKKDVLLEKVTEVLLDL